MDNKLCSVRNAVKSVFENSTQRRYLEHTLRVYRFCEWIGVSEGANMDILLPAALLHDIGMTVDSGFPSHVDKSRLLGGWILNNSGYDKPSIAKILKVACSHHPKPGVMLDTLEEKVLFDSDSMEIIGVFGLLRWIGKLPDSSTELISSIEMFLGMVEECSRARGSLFFTDTAKTMGSEALMSTIETFERIRQYLSQFAQDSEKPLPFPFGSVGNV